MPQLYIIAGCNGAGKTTASLTVLPEILDCQEFVNADLIAYGLSPLNPDGVALEAGRLMLTRIKELLEEGKNFAFETTLATRSYRNLVRDAQKRGYKVSLLFFWLHSSEQAARRVAHRVRKGGHDIPPDVIRRRHKRGIANFMSIYKNEVDAWMFFDNSKEEPVLIARGDKGFGDDILNAELWGRLEPIN